MPFDGVLDVLQPEPPNEPGPMEQEQLPSTLVLVEPAQTKGAGDPNDWTLHRDLIFRVDEDVIVVKAGSTTDFASTPQPLQWLIPKTGRYTKPAVMHDFLWRTGPVPRSKADLYFRRALEEGPDPVPFCKRWVMWAGVRWTSLAKSWFRDGWQDLPKLLLVSVSPPGLLALAGGILMTIALLLFFVVEIVTSVILVLLRRASRLFRARTAPPGLPSMNWKR